MPPLVLPVGATRYRTPHPRRRYRGQSFACFHRACARTRDAHRPSHRWRCRQWKDWRCCCPPRGGLFGDGIGVQALFFQSRRSDFIKTDFGERSGMTFATTRVGIDLLYQLTHAVDAIATHIRRPHDGQRRPIYCPLPAGGNRHPAGSVPQNVIAEALRYFKRTPDFGFTRRLTVTPLPWLPSSGLTTTGRAISCAAVHASSALCTGRPSGTGTPAARSSFLVSALVLCNGFGNRAGESAETAWMRRCFATPAHLHQAAAGQSPARNAAVDSPYDNRAGAWPQPHLLV